MSEQAMTDICTETAHGCKCSLPADHQAYHKCLCGNSWAYERKWRRWRLLTAGLREEHT